MSKLGLLRDSQSRSLRYLKRYNAGSTSAISLLIPVKIPKVLKQSEHLKHRTPIVAPHTKPTFMSMTPLEAMLKEKDLGDISKKVPLRSKNETEHNKDAKFPMFAPLMVVDEANFIDVLFQKIESCTTVMCNFSRQEFDAKAKEEKLACLLDLKSVLEDTVTVKHVNYMHLKEFVTMIEAHLDVERLPIDAILWQTDWSSLDFCEPAWPHLSVVYQILMQLLNVYKSQVHISERLMNRILERMSSPDARERETVVAFLSVYLKMFGSKRNTIITKLVQMLIAYIDTLNNPFLVPSILQMWKMFPKWFDEKIKKPLSVLVPLCNSPDVPLYFSLVIPIIDMYITASEDKQKMVRTLVDSFPPWPAKNQIIRILIVSKILEEMDESDFRVVRKSVTRLLQQCASCENAKVAQSSFNLWNNHKITNLFKLCAKDIQEDLYCSIVCASRSHWSPLVRGGAKFVLKSIQRLSGNSFECMHKRRQQATASATSLNWNRVLNTAAANDAQFAEIMLVKRYEIENSFRTWDKEESRLRNSRDLFFTS